MRPRIIQARKPMSPPSYSSGLIVPISVQANIWPL
jgi:hypothetical protein